MTARCETTGLVLGECAGSCCRPDLRQYQPVPEVWVRVTEPASRRVVPSRTDVAVGNVHALFQVVSGRTTQPDVTDMVRELCEPSSHLVRLEQQTQQTQAPRKSKGKTRRRKASRSAGRAPRYHRTVEPPLLEQLYQSVEPSSSAEAGVSRPASSRPAARLDAIDTANRIDQRVGAWLNHLDATAPGRQPGEKLTESELRTQDSMTRLRHLASLLPALDHCGRRTPRRDEQKQVICCDAHLLENDIHRWWKWARIVTGWDAPAWQPDNTCPLCGVRGSLRIRFEDQIATCINDACRETWDHLTIGLLADHIRAENNDTEEITPVTTRRTKRRYAHELYPHAREGETRTLEVEMPYLYAYATGLDVWGTSWSLEPGQAVARIRALGQARRIAFLADALMQGMTGDQAWVWADERAGEESGEWVHERAMRHGVAVEKIKPYPCGPEPDHHDHYDEPEVRGLSIGHSVAGKESECPDCTEDIPADNPERTAS